MKTILGSLLCLVLFASECFAIKGGPIFTEGVNVIGTYAGVLQPNFDPTDPFSANSLGVFTLGIPSIGASTGNFLIFTRGRVFGGTIQGVTDPNKGNFSGLVDATFTYMLTTFAADGTTVTTSVTATVNGPVTAKVVSTRSPFATSSARLTGSATAFISNGGVEQSLDPTIDGTLTLSVAGFKQSDTDPGAGTLTPPSQ